MYYKIENKESDVYKKLYAMRRNELRIEEDNKARLEKQFGKFKAFFGSSGQQNFFRVSHYSGFKFTNPEKIDMTAWKQHKDHADIFVPNRKTKAGKAAEKFIESLEGGWVDDPLKILGIYENKPNSFHFPFVEIAGEIIVLYLDDQMKPEDENVIEITRKEFDSLYPVQMNK